MSRTLLDGAVFGTLARQSLPTMVGVLSLACLGAVDVFVLGELGTDAQAAAAFCSPVIMLAGTITTGLANGCTVLVSWSLGQGKMRQVREYVWAAALLALFTCTIFVVIGLMKAHQVLTLLGASPAQAAFASTYLKLLFLAIPAIAGLQIGNGILRALGDLISPGLCLFIVFMVKVLTVFPLTFGVGAFAGMGMEGAGISFIFAWLVGTITALVVLFRLPSTPLGLVAVSPQTLISKWGNLLAQGAPVAVSGSLTTALSLVMTRLMASSGIFAVAAVGILTKIEALVCMVALALGLVLVPFIGQNLGAGQVARVKEAALIARWFCIIWGASSALLLTIGRGGISNLFSSDPLVISTLATGLSAVSWGFMGTMTLQITCSMLNAARRPAQALALNAGYVMAALGAIITGYHWGGLAGFFIAYPAIALALLVPCFRVQRSLWRDEG